MLLGTSTFYFTRLRLIDVFVSLPSFTLPVELVLCLFPFCPIDHSLYCICWLLEFMLWYPCQIAKIYWQSSCLWQEIKEGHDLMQKKKSPLLTKSVHFYKISKFFFLRGNSCCCHIIFTSIVNFSLIVSTVNTSWSIVLNVKHLR